MELQQLYRLGQEAQPMSKITPRQSITGNESLNRGTESDAILLKVRQHLHFMGDKNWNRFHRGVWGYTVSLKSVIFLVSFLRHHRRNPQTRWLLINRHADSEPTRCVSPVNKCSFSKDPCSAASSSHRTIFHAVALNVVATATTNELR